MAVSYQPNAQIYIYYWFVQKSSSGPSAQKKVVSKCIEYSEGLYASKALYF